MKEGRLLGLLVGAGALALLLAILIGPTPLAPGRAWAAFLRVGAPSEQLIIWDIRLPRALAAYLVGAALGASGAALQGLFRNPLADPGVLGVSASASLAATTSLHFGLASSGLWGTPVAAVLGALAATGLLALASTRTSSVVTLVLIGAGLSSFAGALMSLLLNLTSNPFSLFDLINWTLGSVANRSLSDLALAGPFLAAGGLLLLNSARGLSALSLGEEAAAGLGLNLRHTRLSVIIGAGLATGGAVSLAGSIGFVGLVAPHLVRPLVGHDPARSLTPAGLLGGVLLVLADMLVRLAPTGAELKLGVAAALVGAPAFVWIALQRRSAGA